MDSPVMIRSSALQIDRGGRITFVANAGLGPNSEPLVSVLYVLVTLMDPTAPSEVQ
jgi:hypothetical protein